MERKLDIFKVLAAIDRGDTSFYQNLTPEERKGYAPLVIQRWLSGCDDPRQVVYLNELVNVHVFQLGQHPALLHSLLCAASSKKSRRYRWLNSAGLGTKKVQNLVVQVIAQHLQCSTTDAASRYLRLFSAAEIIEMGEQQGLQKPDMDKLKKLLQDG